MTDNIPRTRENDVADAAVPHNSKVGLATLGLLLGALLSVLDQTIVGVALPDMAEDFGGMGSISWVVTAYLLASTVTATLYGRISDRLGRRGVFLAAVTIFVVGSILCGAAQSTGQLIAARTLQGIGAGGLFVIPTIALSELYPSSKRGRAQGLMGVVMAASGVGGPLIGGAITDVASWRWIFYVNVPIGLLSLALVAYALRLPKPRSSYRIDLPGALLLASFIVCLLLVTEWGGRDYAWGSTQVLALSAGAVAALGTFLFWERRIAYPIIPLGLFANRTLLAGFPAAFLLGMLLGGSIIFLPTFLQNGFGMSATRAGLALLPYVIAFMLVSAVASSKAGQSGKFKPYLLAGSAVSALALWLLSRMDLDTSYLVIAIYFAVLGLGFGLIMQNLVVVSQNAVRHEELGVTTSTTLSLRGLGMSVGVALFGSLLSRELHGRPDTPEMTAEAIPDILFWGVPLAALTFVLVALLPRPATTSRADSGGDTPATQDTRARTDAGGSR